MRRAPGNFVHTSWSWWIIESVMSGLWGLCKVVYRWNLGRDLDGEPRTDATWLTAGETALTKTGKASAWSYLPQWKRAVTRHVVVLATLGSLWGLANYPTLTRLAWGLTLAGAVVWLGFRVRAAMLMREHRDTYVLPLGQTLGPLIGYTDVKSSDKIERWLDIPVDFLTSDERPEMRVMLLRTQHYDDKLKTTVLKLIADKLGKGLDELDYQWFGKGAAPYISLRVAPKPPSKVAFDVLAGLMDKARDAAPVMGIGARGKVITSNFDSESPHVAVSASSGAGKSVWGRLMIAQFLNRGAQVVILDKKRVSQNWCKNLPGVTYCRETVEMHEILLKLAAELQRRYKVIDSAEDPDNADVGPRIILFFEEQNAGMAGLKKYWNSIRENSDPKTSPAIDALEEMLFAGRQARMHVISIAQLFTVQAAGGNTAARENYATRLMARATANAWKMLLPECAPFPKLNRKQGRWYIGIDGTAVEFQVGFLSEEEATAWAQAGHVTVPAQWDSRLEQSQDAVTGGSVTAPAGPERYSLAEAVRAGFVGEIADKEAETRTYNWLRQAKKRAGDKFPEGVTEGGKTKYTEAEIRGWYEASTLEAVTAEESSE